MRKYAVALLAAGMMGLSCAPAHAAITTDPINGATLESFGSEFFGAARSESEGTGIFSDVFNFVLSQDWLTNAQVSSIILQSRDIDFTSILLDGIAFAQTSFDPDTETWELTPTSIGSGPHALTVNGTISGPGGGSYSGTINVAPAIPEPGTWALMLLGFGMAGFALRRRRRHPAMIVQAA